MLSLGAMKSTLLLLSTASVSRYSRNSTNAMREYKFCSRCMHIINRGPRIFKHTPVYIQPPILSSRYSTANAQLPLLAGNQYFQDSISSTVLKIKHLNQIGEMIQTQVETWGNTIEEVKNIFQRGNVYVSKPLQPSILYRENPTFKAYRMYLCSLIILLELLLHPVFGANIRAIYLFKDVLKSNTTALTTSSFNTLIIFGVGVLEDGSIMYYSNTPGSTDVKVASNGAYTGGAALAAKLKSFKAADSPITRLEISMNSQHIKNLMSKPGPGANTPLYQNFAALKTAWGLDAVNNDDESLYDVSSTLAFAKMLGSIGYKYTGAPYTNTAFWKALVSQANQGLSGTNLLFDRTYLQCYDGGAGNDPSAWAKNLGMDVVPLVWVTNDAKPVYGMTAAAAKAKFQGWKARGGVAGGGYWNDYDIEKMGLSYKDYGNALSSVFP